MAAAVGESAPDFTLMDQGRRPVSLSDLRGKKSLIVFFPFAFSRTCQGELCSIRDNLHSLDAADANVVAISCDHFYSNRAWTEQEGFGFKILSDHWPHGAVSRAYGCFDEQIGCAIPRNLRSRRDRHHPGDHLHREHRPSPQLRQLPRSACIDLSPGPSRTSCRCFVGRHT